MHHRGHTIEKVIRKSGYSLGKLAKKLCISRSTLYRRFEDPNLNYNFILAVGDIIRYDFTVDLPAIKNCPHFNKKFATHTLNSDTPMVACWRTQEKYSLLLDRYEKLRRLLSNITENIFLG